MPMLSSYIAFHVLLFLSGESMICLFWRPFKHSALACLRNQSISESSFYLLFCLFNYYAWHGVFWFYLNMHGKYLSFLSNRLA